VNRLDDNERAVMERNPDTEADFVGEEVLLDSAQQYLLDLYLDLRRVTPSDRGIDTSREGNEIVKGHLRAMDQAYMSDQADAAKKRMERMRADRQ
jgi:hypothetical protein